MFGDFFNNIDDMNDDFEMNDATVLDLDNNGYFETIAYDTNIDGSFDFFGVDTNGDFQADTFFADVDHSNTIDFVGADLDADNVIDFVAADYNVDGEFDLFDENLLVDVDGHSFEEWDLEVDDDTEIELMDVYDSNNNGYADAYFIDMDDNDIVDTIILDPDENGVADAVLADIDGTGDFETMFVDDDQSGDFDFALIDSDVNGEFDDIIDFNDELQHNLNPTNADADAYNSYESFNPDDADGILGDPNVALDSWHMQNGNSCAVVSQEFILEEYFGRDFDEEELKDVAEANGWYDEAGGTKLEDVGNLLEHYGIDVERSFENDFSDLRQSIDDGNKVIVCVDADELWHGESDDMFGPGMDMDHAIEVVGIDESDPDDIKVIVNDSGVSNGQCVMVPVDQFMESWEDSGFFMLEADI